MNLGAREGGFTLIELLVTLLVAAVILTVAIPSFRSVMERNRVATAADQIMSSLNYARSAAVNRGVSVTLCPSTSGTNCTSTNAASLPQGWIVFTDAGTPGTVDGTDKVLRVGNAAAGTQVLVQSGFANGYTTYSSDGFSASGGGSLDVCPTGSGQPGALVTINPAGGVSSSAITCP